ncbi:uncharacterized protein B0I36DRAFT_85835 [Microdochium trichocladiopsis]|uniref:BZIP domain-containing protein n=1 Tax=Microdochium trichocladiopsis TaxID=1682393 RepID=A0A9P9BSY5_9PEZI|nr:uncharacterized protein B0I36DRAFT_85835 [Microdochium trichocladiopsis]KAH7034937.1 hypothetical protein B0I36DRAFT_85835 [Microdochium trichocladiopsis]
MDPQAILSAGGLEAIEIDTQRLFEDYWQRGKYDGKPLVLDAAILAQATGGNSSGETGEPGSGQGKGKGRAGSKPDLQSATSSGSTSSANEATTSETTPALTKAQARRAQVRRAQIQHRQRKADYTKQLEMETAKYRDLVGQTQRETYALEAENTAMRKMLLDKLGYLPPEALPSSSSSDSLSTEPSADAMAWEATGGGQVAHVSSSSERSNSASSIPTPVYSVSVAMSEVMGTPAMQVRRTSSPPQVSSRSGSVSKSRTPPSAHASMASEAASQHGNPQVAIKPADIITSLTEEQTDHAINFILGLEHICWDHWDRSYFTHQAYDETGCMHGHALMASTIALQTAPVEVFNQLDAVGEYLRSNPLQQHDRSKHGKCDHNSMPMAHLDQDQHAMLSASDETSTISSSAHATSLTRSPESGSTASTSGGSLPQTSTAESQMPQSGDASRASGPSIPMLQDGNNISWPATGLSLETLHALASKLSPPQTELAPVQAWFEILREYGTAVVLDHELMGRVLAEFSGVVKCLHFGAVIERDAFDSVVSRVIAAAHWS